MLTSTSVLFFIGLLLTTVILEPLAKKLRIPFSIVLILLGFASSEIVVKLFSVDTGIRWDNFQIIILKIFLPVIIFQAALKLDIRAIYRDFIPLIFLALPLMLVAVSITAAVLYYGIGYPQVFPWHTAILAGALLSATDPSSVVSILKQTKAPERLITLLESESLFNDASAVVLFSLLVSMTLLNPGVADWQSTALTFAKVFSGGIIVGVAASAVVYLLIRFIDGEHVYALTSLIAAYGAYIIAGDVLSCSGVMAVLTTGLIINELPNIDKKIESVRFTETLWQFAAQVIDRLIYLLAGITITVTMFKEQWLAMILGILAVIIARAFIILLLLPLICYILRLNRFPAKHLLVLNWGGVRGTVTLALALSLPFTLDTWFTLQSIAYGVVLFSVFFQTGSMNFLVRKLKLEAE
ncbi:MAG: CPA1 family monovalent cation:H+ antiporter [Gammaproteobacteria bacterium]|jgi:CPA1 family monovalent cation:H+ antiporter